MDVIIKSINYEHQCVNNSNGILTYILSGNTKIDAIVIFGDGHSIKGEFTFPYIIEGYKEAESKIKEYLK